MSFLKEHCTVQEQKTIVASVYLKVLLQLSDDRFLFLHCAMLFEELVEQHRVDLLVADRFGLPLGIASHQIGYTLATSSAIRPKASVCVASYSLL